MRRLKLICVFVSFALVLSLSACKKQPAYDNVSFSPDDFEVRSKVDTSVPQTDDGENAASDPKTARDTSSKSKTDNKSDDKSEPYSGNETSYNGDTQTNTGATFEKMQIPSRKNAYKLSNTYSKIKSNQTVNVVYFGGSITGGEGASDDAHSWSALTTAYLKTLSPNINDTNVSVGGTGSYLGAVRFEHNVLTANPDLLIIEFAVNDNYSGISETQIKANLEYMIRRLYAKNKNADIIIALTTNTSTYGNQYTNYKAHKAVADHYGIPVVDLGGEMYNRLKGSREGFSDSVHPNDVGHRLYADIMIDALKELLTDKPLSAHTLPSTKLYSGGFSSIYCERAADISVDKKVWTCYSWLNNEIYEKKGSPLRTNKHLKDIFPKYLAPDANGCTVTYTFTGNSFGIIGMIKSNAILTVILEDGTKVNLKGNSNTASTEYPAFENLTNAKHTVTITVNGTNPYVAIAAFITTKA